MKVVLSSLIWDEERQIRLWFEGKKHGLNMELDLQSLCTAALIG
jgi:hypothetical protein